LKVLRRVREGNLICCSKRGLLFFLCGGEGVRVPTTRREGGDLPRFGVQRGKCPSSCGGGYIAPEGCFSRRVQEEEKTFLLGGGSTDQTFRGKNVHFPRGNKRERYSWMGGGGRPIHQAKDHVLQGGLEARLSPEGEEKVLDRHRRESTNSIQQKHLERKRHLWPRILVKSTLQMPLDKKEKKGGETMIGIKEGRKAWF